MHKGVPDAIGQPTGRPPLISGTNDLRFALRQLAKSPKLTSLAIITLATGIALNSVVFSLINDLLLRRLPFEDPNRLVHIYGALKQFDARNLPLSAPRFMRYRDGNVAFSDVGAENPITVTVTGLGDPFEIKAGATTANYLGVLGVRPIRGRTFSAKEEEGADVAIISENFWQQRLGGDPNVIGRSITLDGISHSIVGVIPNMPPAWFKGIVEIWKTKPFVIPGFSYDRMMRGTGFLRVVGRLRPGVTVDQATALLPALDKSYQAEFATKSDRSWTTYLVPVPEDTTGKIRPALITILTAVVFVLLIACSNAGNLFLIRFSERRHEIALRIALGASRFSVFRLFICETLFVGLISGLIGVLIASRLLQVLPIITRGLLPLQYSPRGAIYGLSLPVLWFTMLLSILTGVIVGIYPAWCSSRPDVVAGLKDGGHAIGPSIRQQRFRSVLVGAQVAFSTMLLAGASLLVSSFLYLTRQDAGFRSSQLWIGVITLRQEQYPDVSNRQTFAEEILTALRATPGFESVSLSGDIPLEGGSTIFYTRSDGTVLPVHERAVAPVHDVSPGYFRTWRTPLLSGRDFTDDDGIGHPAVILISEASARKLFPNETPIGRTLLITSNSESAEIIGIVGDVRSRRLTDVDDVVIYRPWSQENYGTVYVHIRSSLPGNEITRMVKKQLSNIDPQLALDRPEQMQNVIARSAGPTRFTMLLLGSFGIVALLLATIGTYGAVACSVDQRVGEIGLRIALGAQSRDLLRLIVTAGMRPVISGLVAGLAGSLAVGQVISAQLYRTSPSNPTALATATIVLGSAALIACLISGRRATMIDPVRALRTKQY